MLRASESLRELLIHLSTETRISRGKRQRATFAGHHQQIKLDDKLSGMNKVKAQEKKLKELRAKMISPPSNPPNPDQDPLSPDRALRTLRDMKREAVRNLLIDSCGTNAPTTHSRSGKLVFSMKEANNSGCRRTYAN